MDMSIIELIDKYNATPRLVVAANVRRLTKDVEAGYIADRVGVSTQTVYGWYKTNRGNKPPFDTAYKLCHILGVEMDELMRPADVPTEDDLSDLPPCKECGEPANAAMGMCWRCYQRNAREKKRAIEFANKAK
jgi:transcriptional regulator with XRE-family HTH domain